MSASRHGAARPAPSARPLLEEALRSGRGISAFDTCCRWACYDANGVLLLAGERRGASCRWFRVQAIRVADFVDTARARGAHLGGD